MSKELITVVTVCFNAGQTIAKTNPLAELK